MTSFTSRSASPDLTSSSELLPELNPTTYKVYATASARLYHSAFGTPAEGWTSSRLRGLLVFGKDRELGTEKPGADAGKLWFRLVDLGTQKTIWVFKLPARLDYSLDKPFFHVFSGRSRRFGLLFDDDEEAAAIARKVLHRIGSKLEVKPSTTKPSSAPKPIKPRNSRKASKRQLTKTSISSPDPQTFAHLAHLGISADGDIEASPDMDPQWTVILSELQGRQVMVPHRGGTVKSMSSLSSFSESSSGSELPGIGLPVNRGVVTN